MQIFQKKMEMKAKAEVKSGDSSSVSSPVTTTKVSRFQVSVIREAPKETQSKEPKREMKTGRFSVVTHEEGEKEDKEPAKMFYKTTPAAFLIGTSTATDMQSFSVSILLISIKLLGSLFVCLIVSDSPKKRRVLQSRCPCLHCVNICNFLTYNHYLVFILTGVNAVMLVDYVLCFMSRFL